MSFSELGLCPEILKAVEEQGYSTPTPIQQQAIPAILKRRDIMAAAQTGTGKTGGFTLPMLERLAKRKQGGSNTVGSNQTRALVLTPTRELAAQVEDSIRVYGKHLRIKSTVVFGGVKINPQMMRLRSGTDVLVATPGRLLDLHSQNAIRFDELEFLVLDEADRMLDMGFIHDIRKILRLLPNKRQSLLFSATFSDDVRKLAKTIVHNPVEIAVTPRNSTAKSVKQLVHPVDKGRKRELLAHLIESNGWFQVLVFAKTKHGANKLTKFLNDRGMEAAAIHGNKSQGARTRALAEFKRGDLQVLVATDIAARGLDIDCLPHVVNFDLPNVPEDYVHRIGRTGRAGKTGEALSLVSADEAKLLFDIERLIKRTLKREEIDGFTPEHIVPTTERSKPRKPAREGAKSPNSRTKKKPSAARPGKKKGPGGRSNGTKGETRTGTKTAPKAETKVNKIGPKKSTAKGVKRPSQSAGRTKSQPMSKSK